MQGQDSRAARWLGFGAIIIALGFGIAWVVKATLLPKMEKEKQEELIRRTSDGREYATVLKVGHDDFSSYAILRSSEMQTEMDRYDTRLYFVDDKADYGTRLRALKTGELDMAFFTIADDLVAGDALGEFPGVITWVYDKSNGADGIVCYEQAVPNADALNQSGAKIVALSDSPSETIARHLVANALPAIRSEQWLVATGSQDETLERLRKANREVRQCFALWEPSLSIALTIPGTINVYNSAMVSGTIVDVVMVRRELLDQNPELVQRVMESSFTVLNRLVAIEGGLAELVIRDAASFGKTLSRQQADKIVSGILWANTMENYALFGLLPREQSQGLPHIRMMVDQIARFLVKTGKLKRNPVEGNEQLLFTGDVLARMKSAGYKPADGQIEAIRGRKTLPKLTDEQWDRLVYVANLDAVEIAFRPSSTTLSGRANRLIDEIVEQLDNWPGFYVEVTGRAMAGGDDVVNRTLALERAQAVSDALIGKGVSPNRARTKSESQANHGLGRSVTFRLLQKTF